MMTQSGTAPPSNRLAWLDLEMTGLDPSRDEILEMAIVVTDYRLDVVAKSQEWVFGCAEDKLQGMDSWNQQTHAGSGLLELVRNATLGYAQAEREALDFLAKHVAADHSPLCGNTICQDRRFLARHMPALSDFFHYRNFDVTSFKLAVDYWMAAVPSKGKKNNRHRAMDDVLESIEEMAYYRALLFKQ